MVFVIPIYQHFNLLLGFYINKSPLLFFLSGYYNLVKYDFRTLAFKQRSGSQVVKVWVHGAQDMWFKAGEINKKNHLEKK